MKYGKGTKWCISGTDSPTYRRHFIRYSHQANIYVLITTANVKIALLVNHQGKIYDAYNDQDKRMNADWVYSLIGSLGIPRSTFKPAVHDWFKNATDCITYSMWNNMYTSAVIYMHANPDENHQPIIDAFVEIFRVYKDDERMRASSAARGALYCFSDTLKRRIPELEHLLFIGTNIELAVHYCNSNKWYNAALHEKINTFDIQGQEVWSMNAVLNIDSLRKMMQSLKPKESHFEMDPIALHA